MKQYNRCILTSLILFYQLVSFGQSVNAPSGLTANTLSNNSVQLSWIDNATNETGFKVERSLSADTDFESLRLVSNRLVNESMNT